MKLPTLARSRVEELTVDILRPAEKTRPEVRLIKLDGRLFVIKDYAVNGTLFKRVLGMYLAQRERAALQRAAGLEGVPALGPQIGTDALVTAYMDAREVTSASRDLLTAEFFEELAGMIGSLHARGVVHADLKKLENILVTADSHPRLVDFTSAFCTGSNPLTALLFPWLADDDRKAVCKLKKHAAPQLLSEAEDAFLTEMSSLESAFRWFRRYVRYFVKFFSTPEQDRASVRLK